MSTSFRRALCGLFTATLLTAAHAEDRPWYLSLDAGLTPAGRVRPTAAPSAGSSGRTGASRPR